jgi:hypothetical protein
MLWGEFVPRVEQVSNKQGVACLTIMIKVPVSGVRRGLM